MTAAGRCRINRATRAVPVARPGLAGAALRSGSRTRNVVPRPGSLSAEIVPPCASTIALEMVRPSPEPWIARLVTPADR